MKQFRPAPGALVGARKHFPGDSNGDVAGDDVQPYPGHCFPSHLFGAESGK